MGNCLVICGVEDIEPPHILGDDNSWVIKSDDPKYSKQASPRIW